jgi:hypothetical protein
MDCGHMVMVVVVVTDFFQDHVLQIDPCSICAPLSRELGENWHVIDVQRHAIHMLYQRCEQNNLHT